MPMVQVGNLLQSLAAVTIKGPWPATRNMKATDLWSDGKPTVVYAIRRMG